MIECSLFTFLSDVVWNNEALDCSLDLVVSHSSINMEQILVRMNGVSEDVLQEEASSQFSLLIELSIIWNIASVKLNTSSVAINQSSVPPVGERGDQLEPPCQNRVMLLMPVGNSHVVVRVLEVKLRWAIDVSSTTHDCTIEQSFVEVLLKSHHPELL